MMAEVKKERPNYYKQEAKKHVKTLGGGSSTPALTHTGRVYSLG